MAVSELLLVLVVGLFAFLSRWLSRLVNQDTYIYWHFLKSSLFCVAFRRRRTACRSTAEPRNISPQPTNQYHMVVVYRAIPKWKKISQTGENCSSSMMCDCVWCKANTRYRVCEELMKRFQIIWASVGSSNYLAAGWASEIYLAGQRCVLGAEAPHSIIKHGIKYW